MSCLNTGMRLVAAARRTFFSGIEPSPAALKVPGDFVRAWALVEERHAKVWAFGHSHHARVWRKASASAMAERLSGDVVSMDVEDRWQYFVNVGTTGLPFPGKGGPSVALVDFVNGTIRQLPLQESGYGSRESGASVSRMLNPESF